MGVVGRKPERTVDPRFELLGDHVLEPVGLVVDSLHIEPQRLGEIELDQAVVADHLQRHPLAVRGEPGTAVGLVLDQPERRELLHHRRRGSGRDTLILRDGADRHPPFRRLQLVDGLEVVLDRLREPRVRHQRGG